MNARDGRSVQRVAAVLDAAGATDRVIELAGTARRAEDAAAALGVPVGAIVKSLVFEIAGRPVLALVAGDRHCAVDVLGSLLDLGGEVARASADQVREATGFAIGGVPPVGHRNPLPTAISMPASAAFPCSGPLPAIRIASFGRAWASSHA